MGFVNLEFHGIHVMEPEGFTCAVFRWVENNRILPIWMGIQDAAIIDAHDEGITPRRPGPQEVLADALTRLTSGVSAINIVSYHEGVYMACVVTSDGVELDIRPSDAIILSQILEMPIGVDEDILSQTSVYVGTDDLRTLFGILVDELPEDDAPESASGDAQADADFEQLMESLGVSELDLLGMDSEGDETPSSDDAAGSDGEDGTTEK